jgi:hypothetical protein
MKQIGEMNFNQTTHYISLVLMAITALYTLVYGGVTGLLFCSSIGLLVAAFVDNIELVAVATVLFALFYLFFLKSYLKRMEPFQNQSDEIVHRVGEMASKYRQNPQSLSNPRLEPAGVYNPAIEGFEDTAPGSSKDGAPSNSSSASTVQTKDQVDKDHVKEVTSAVQGSKKSDKEIEEDEIKSATGALFKSGKMPSENVDGPKLNAGKTIMKAMESFDTNTIGAMTDDTKKLLETQKSLMGMLTQMRPVLADGKELLQTFSGMFGNNSQGSGMKFSL